MVTVITGAAVTQVSINSRVGGTKPGFSAPHAEVSLSETQSPKWLQMCVCVRK